MNIEDFNNGSDMNNGVEIPKDINDDSVNNQVDTQQVVLNENVSVSPVQEVVQTEQQVSVNTTDQNIS